MRCVDLVWILINETVDWRNLNTDWYLMILKKLTYIFGVMIMVKGLSSRGLC